MNQPLDWTLDCLLDITGYQSKAFNNINYKRIVKDIKDFKPDLIISDMEIYISHIGLSLNIPVWQISPILLYYALPNYIKYNLSLNKNYAYIFQNQFNTAYIKNIIENSDKRFVYSFWGDAKSKPQLKEGFEWLRPYFLKAKDVAWKTYDHMAVSTSSRLEILKFLKGTGKHVMFSDFIYDNYDDIDIKDLKDKEEYQHCLGQIDYLLSSGETSFVSDAFYNEKNSIIFTKTSDIESLLNSSVIQYLNIGATTVSNSYNFSPFEVYIDNSIKMLHEKIEELCFTQHLI